VGQARQRLAGGRLPVGADHFLAGQARLQAGAQERGLARARFAADHHQRLLRIGHPFQQKADLLLAAELVEQGRIAGPEGHGPLDRVGPLLRRWQGFGRQPFPDPPCRPQEQHTAEEIAHQGRPFQRRQQLHQLRLPRQPTAGHDDEHGREHGQPRGRLPLEKSHRPPDAVQPTLCIPD